MTGLVFIVVVVAVVLAIVFFVQARSTGAALLQLRKEQDDLEKAGEGNRTKVKELEAELKAKGQHLVEAREKLADARKKSEPKRQTQQSRGAREAELEEDLKNARELVLQAHAAETKARKEAAQAKAELAAAQLRVEKLAKQAGLAQPVAPASAQAPRVVSDAVLAEKLVRSEGELKRAAAEVIELRAALQAAKDKELGLKDELRKSKGRVETNNRVYLVTKGEVELQKERLGQAERLLWKAGIVLPKPEAKERPKATGPLAADRPRVEKAEEKAEVQAEQQSEQSVPVEPAPASTEAAGGKLETAALALDERVAKASTETSGALAQGGSEGRSAAAPQGQVGRAAQELRSANLCRATAGTTPRSRG